MNALNEAAAAALTRLRAERPLIHQITNYVVMNDTANATLHIGASPVMAHAAEEVAEMVQYAGALVLNYGTLSGPWIEAMLLAGRAANRLGVPIVLDPVGAGATRLRTETGHLLLEELNISIVRGNAGEIAALAGAGGKVKGVDSLGTEGDPVEAARRAARAWGGVVAMTGKRDIITDGERAIGVDNGDAWLQTRTGTGCVSTAITGAFAAVEKDYVVAAASALAAYGVAAEAAAAGDPPGPASFHLALFDALYHLTPEDVRRKARFVEL